MVTVRSSTVDERAQISSEATGFDAALLRYISETTKRERRRRFLERGKWAVLLIASFLMCQWPYVRSDAADAVVIEHEAAQSATGLAAFACPHLGSLITEHASRGASLERLRFAGAGLLDRGWAL
jgi:hypothetical protein